MPHRNLFIPREESPERSLLTELPIPNAIPKGVIFVLGTQQLSLAGLSSSVKQQASINLRSTSMQPLDRTAIHKLVKSSNFEIEIDPEKVFEISEGHPLSVRYYLNALKSCQNSDEANEVFSSDTGLGGNIDEIYERVWRKLTFDSATKKVLGVLSRLEEQVTPEELSLIVEAEAIESVLHTAGFLLKENDRSEISLWHNSFRLFVQRETATKFGKYSASHDAEYYRALADLASAVKDSSSQKWLSLRYLFRAGASTEVLGKITSGLCLSQLKQGRNFSEIYADVKMAYRCLSGLHDSRKLCEIMCIEKELDYRFEAFSDYDFVEYFFELGEFEIAVELAKRGQGISSWPKVVTKLIDTGNFESAQLVFQAHEPSSIICSSEKIDLHSDNSVFQAWLQLAPYFYSTEILVNILENAKFDEGVDHDLNEEGIRENLKLFVAKGLIRARVSVSVEEILLLLHLDHEYS